jgi:hypothetical protein
VYVPPLKANKDLPANNKKTNGINPFENLLNT